MASSLLLAVVFLFDLIAFALAVVAEQRRTSATLLRNAEGREYCQYDSDIATGLGVGSLFLLVACQVIIMIVTRCLCCGKAMRPSGSRSWAICLFITTWLTFTIAAACLLAGSVRNAYHTKYRDLLGERAPTCQTLRKGVFGAGAAFIVLTGIVSELYYEAWYKETCLIYVYIALLVYGLPTSLIACEAATAEVLCPHSSASKPRRTKSSLTEASHYKPSEAVLTRLKSNPPDGMLESLFMETVWKSFMWLSSFN